MIGEATRGSNSELERAAIRLAGLWKLDPAADALKAIAVSLKVDDGLRARRSIPWPRSVAGWDGRTIEALTARDQPFGTRIPAVAALAKLDVDAAAARAAEILTQPIAQAAT